MSLLYNHHSGLATWGTDRNFPVATHYTASSPDGELLQLTEQAGVLDMSHYGVVSVTGEDRIAFLSGLITNQIRKVSATQGIYAALLTPQGRYLVDFTILEFAEGFVIITEPGTAPGLVEQLSMYRLRSKVVIRDVSADWGLVAMMGPETIQRLTGLFSHCPLTDAALGMVFSPEEQTLLWRDPRHEAFGWRMLTKASLLPALWTRLIAVAAPVGWKAWRHYRLRHGLPRGGCELIPNETLPLEAGLVEMNAIDFGKGCYVGQETTARTHHRGTIKKRLFTVCFEGNRLPEAGVEALLPEGKEAGRISSLSQLGGEALGLAILRVSDVEGGRSLRAADVSFTAAKPSWANWDV